MTTVGCPPGSPSQCACYAQCAMLPPCFLPLPLSLSLSPLPPPSTLNRLPSTLRLPFPPSRSPTPHPTTCTLHLALALGCACTLVLAHSSLDKPSFFIACLILSTLTSSHRLATRRGPSRRSFLFPPHHSLRRIAHSLPALPSHHLAVTSIPPVFQGAFLLLLHLVLPRGAFRRWFALIFAPLPFFSPLSPLT